MNGVDFSLRRLLWGMLPLLTTGCGLLSGLNDLEIIDCNANCEASVVRDGADVPPGELDASDAATAMDASLPEGDVSLVDASVDQTSLRDAIRADNSAPDTAVDTTIDTIDAPVDSMPSADSVPADVSADRSDPRLSAGGTRGFPYGEDS